MAESAGDCQPAEVGCASETHTFESELMKSNKESGSVLPVHFDLRGKGTLIFLVTM